MTSRPEETQTADRLWAEYSRNHDPRTRDAIILQFQRLAYSVANRFSRSGMEREDLEQIALLGLVRAVDRFDPTTRNRFSTFAVPTIVGEIKRHFRDHGWNLHVPRSLHEMASSVARARREMTGELGRAPSTTELAGRLKVSEQQVDEVLALEDAQHLVSLDGVLESSDSDSPTVLEGCLGTLDRNLDFKECSISVRQALGRLPEPMRELLEERYLHERSQREVGRRLGVSQMRVSRMEKRALEQLRAQFTAH